MLVLMVPLERLCIGHSYQRIVQNVYIAALYIGIKMMRFIVIFTPNIRIIALQIEANLKKHSVPEFTLNSHPVGSIMRDIKSSKQYSHTHQEIKAIKAQKRGALQHQHIADKACPKV